MWGDGLRAALVPVQLVTGDDGLCCGARDTASPLLTNGSLDGRRRRGIPVPDELKLRGLIFQSRRFPRGLLRLSPAPGVHHSVYAATERDRFVPMTTCTQSVADIELVPSFQPDPWSPATSGAGNGTPPASPALAARSSRVRVVALPGDIVDADQISIVIPVNESVAQIEQDDVHVAPPSSCAQVPHVLKSSTAGVIFVAVGVLGGGVGIVFRELPASGLAVSDVVG